MPAPSTAVPTSGMPICVFDIDGVLADVRHRLHFLAAKPKDWTGFFASASQDSVLEPGRAAVTQQVAMGRRVVYVTGRPQSCRSETRAWLARHGFPQGDLYMRSPGDRRPARIVKPEIITSLKTRSTVAMIFDDDAAVVEALRASFPDITVTHVTWMDDSATHETLFAAQEQDGRT